MTSKTIQISRFPSYVTAKQVTVFLEKYTGEGSVIALKLRPSKNSTVYAIAQFPRREDVQDLFVMIQQGKLSYDGHYLTVRNMERDIIPKPRKPLFVLENVTLHFGCPLSQKRLSVLRSMEDVKVNFGFEMRKIYFLLSHGIHSYKLELAYESIWEIRLHRSSVQNSQFLVVQVCSSVDNFLFLIYFSFLINWYCRCFHRIFFVSVCCTYQLIMGVVFGTCLGLYSLFLSIVVSISLI